MTPSGRLRAQTAAPFEVLPFRLFPAADIMHTWRALALVSTAGTRDVSGGASTQWGGLRECANNYHDT